MSPSLNTQEPLLPRSHTCMQVYTLRPRQDGRHCPDDIFKCFFLNENVSITITISLKFVLKGPINNIPALVQKLAWRRPGDKPLSEPMMVSWPTHICVTRPQWVKGIFCVHRADACPKLIECVRYRIKEVPYCFSRSSVKFQGHTALKNCRIWPKLGVSGL